MAEKPVEWNYNFWLILDGKTFPAPTRADLGFSEDASRPIAAEDLLTASRRLVDEDVALEDSLAPTAHAVGPQPSKADPAPRLAVRYRVTR